MDYLSADSDTNLKTVSDMAVLMIPEKALMQLREQQPANWQLQLSQARQAIKQMRSRMKLGTSDQDTADALYQCMVHGTIPTNYLMAASCLINKLQQLYDDHIQYETNSLRIQQHLNKLDSLKMNSRSIENCRQYYLGWLAKYDRKIDKIVGDIRILEREFKYTPEPSALPARYPGIFRA